ncbi:hypothetical protein HanIR_Chr13g0618921 [Helianthus annuus]|nr:hypothetical protein HanIR_Chr13g0618921 [Helianthus annuus]
MHLLIVTREHFQRSCSVKNEPSPAISKGEFVDALLCECGLVRFKYVVDGIPSSCDPENGTRMTKTRE